MTECEKLVLILQDNEHLDVMYPGDWEKAARQLLDSGVTVKEKQKPLTLDELKEIYSMREDHVWPFERKPPYLYLDSSIEKNDHLWISWAITVDFLVDGYKQYTAENYGKTWRCWADKPTEEERMAAEWN